LMIVADGLGGHQAGAYASQFIIDQLPKQLAVGRAMGMENANGAEYLVSQSLLIIAERLRDIGRRDPERRGMGATIVIGYVIEDKLLIAHMGDSRAYRLHEGRLEQLTQDHNLRNRLRDRGVIDDSAEDMPEYHMLRRFIGMDNPMPPDLIMVDLQKHDRYLICSDGLTNMLNNSVITEILMEDKSCESACSQLIAQANEAGGHDNITVIVADVLTVNSGDRARQALRKQDPQLDYDQVEGQRISQIRVPHVNLLDG